MEPNELIKKFSKIEYGFFDKNGKKYKNIGAGFLRRYRLQSIEHIEKTMVGICWETVELSRYYLEKNGYSCKTYFFVIPRDKFYNHSILVYEKNNKYYWIEYSLVKLKGIREHKSLKDIIFDVLDHFNFVMPKRKVRYEDIKIFEYKIPRANSSCLQFFYHCISSKNLTSEYIPEYLKNIAQKQII